ncbi:MAG: alpha/beta hydrolase [Pseudomonadota bacterium]
MTKAKDVSVRYWLPEDLAKNAPILFVLPGIDRDAHTYRDIWVPYARQERALLLVPQFSLQDYPGSRGYNLGNMFDAKGRPIPPQDWSFTRIEQLFDQVREEIGGTQTGYLLYGHSAGAQFVHRFVLFMPEARIERAVSANAGWYTFPDFNTPFPYGLSDTRLTDADLATAFARDYSILLGTQDTDATHPTLRTTPQAEQQGPNRYARGMAFFEAARAKAADLGVPFRWHVSTVPGATHSNAEMAGPAAHALFGVTG